MRAKGGKECQSISAEIKRLWEHEQQHRLDLEPKPGVGLGRLLHPTAEHITNGGDTLEQGTDPVTEANGQAQDTPTSGQTKIYWRDWRH